MSIETISYITKDELQKIIGQNIRKIAYEKNMNLMKLSEQVNIYCFKKWEKEFIFLFCLQIFKSIRYNH